LQGLPKLDLKVETNRLVAISRAVACVLPSVSAVSRLRANGGIPPTHGN